MENKLKNQIAATRRVIAILSEWEEKANKAFDAECNVTTEAELRRAKSDYNIAAGYADAYGEKVKKMVQCAFEMYLECNCDWMKAMTSTMHINAFESVFAKY